MKKIKLGVDPPWYENDRIPFNLYIMEIEEERKEVEEDEVQYQGARTD